MITKEPHPSIEGLSYRYQVGSLTGWTRTKKEATSSIAKLKRRFREEKVDWSSFIINGKKKAIPSRAQPSGNAG